MCALVCVDIHTRGSTIKKERKKVTSTKNKSLLLVSAVALVCLTVTRQRWEMRRVSAPPEVAAAVRREAAELIFSSTDSTLDR